MVYRICGAIFFILMGIKLLGVGSTPDPIIGVAALIAGIALIAGV